MHEIDGYPPIADHALIGDGRGSALVGRDGAIQWMCVPRFDSPPVFCGLLDRDLGGHFILTPQGLRHSDQRYDQDTGIVITDLETDDGHAQLTDLFTLRAGARLHEDTRAGRGELLRHVRVRHGKIRLHMALHPRGGAGLRRFAGGWRLDWPIAPDLRLQLFASQPIEFPDTTMQLDNGDEFWVLLRWDTSGQRPKTIDPQQLIADTRQAWQHWANDIVYNGPQKQLVRRSAITLKLLDHFENGAIVAAPTSSLPEAIGGVRNWDYRHTWIRDAAFSVFALRRVGLTTEADSFLGWVLDAVERHERPRVLYDLDGNLPPPELIDPDLRGYRGSAPVRWGNAAADQTQHDVYGEILDCAFQWAARGGELDAHLWQVLQHLTENAVRLWRQPDHGIWEVRSPGRPFTYSAAMCQVALDRAARLSRRLNLPGPADRWAMQADQIVEQLLELAWDDNQQAITGYLGPAGGLDASVLALPLRRVLPADHPQMVATTRAITSKLDAGNGLLYRYLPNESPDGLPGGEGAFLLCSFWLADNLLGQGHIDQAADLYDRLCSRTNHVGLLAEQVDPVDGAFLGNFPQALSHVGLISTGVALARALGGAPPELSTGAWFDKDLPDRSRDPLGHP